MTRAQSQIGPHVEGVPQIIHHLLDIAVPRDAVFTALTTGDGIASWWTTSARAEAAAVGAHVEVYFREQFHPRLRISELEPGTALTWEGVEGHDAWGTSTTIRFTLETITTGTRLRFWQRLPDDIGDDAVGSPTFIWGYYLDSLRLYCETGVGKPYQVGMAGARVGASESTSARPS